MTSLSPYHYDFTLTDGSTASLVVNAVGRDKRVLELGCSYGMMTKAMQAQMGCTVIAVDADIDSAEHARPYAERLLIADLDAPDWLNEIAGEQFDVIVAADVLEHLRDPVGCLQAIKPFLKPDGKLVLSIPNVAHNGIVAELLGNDFTYRPTGLLDRTHIHLFAWNSIAQMLDAAGFKTSSIQKKRIEPAVTEFATPWSKLPALLKAKLESRADGDVYQYIVEALQAQKLDIAATNNAIEADSSLFGANGENLQLLEAREVELESKLSDVRAALVKAESDFAELKKVSGVEIAALENKHSTAERALDAMRRSHSWRVTAPLRFVMRLVHHRQLLPADRARIAGLVRRVYYKLPLPHGLRRTVQKLLQTVLGRVENPRKNNILGFGISLRGRLRPAAQKADTPDYIFWGVIDWHFRLQRPQHLAKNIAATGRRVFYISVDFVDNHQPGFAIEPLDKTGRLYQVKLHVTGAPSVYASAPCAKTTASLRASLGEFLLWSESRQLVSVLQHPYWNDVAASLPNSRFVYDCMDHHEGFGNNCESVLALEYKAMERSDLTVVTSDWLEDMAKGHARNRVTIRNAGEYDHFAKCPGKVYRDTQKRRIIGYYGAIADWFDTELIAAVAAAFPDCLILLVGADTTVAHEKLAAYENIVFTGEVPYADLPFYLYAFDVCLLPFRICPITIATNPVKLYEYLSAGANVVAVDVPEMRQFEGLIRVAADAPGFITAIRETLDVAATSEDITARKAFAQQQTWRHRAEAFIESAENAPRPKISVVVITYNQLDFTKACLTSLDANSDDDDMEVIVVDNASADDTPDYLRAWAAAPARGRGTRKLILNPDNKGFAAANNQGLKIASGDYLVMLNNDTFVTPGWAHTLRNHLRDDLTLGLVGPVTNNIGNESKIEIAYASMDEMILQSTIYTRRHLGQETPLRTAAFFCVMISRATFEKVGLLDEIFGLGFFEDDDYCRRIEAQGLRIACAEDAFMHHHLSATFNKLRSESRQQLFETNKATYESRWGAWVPHKLRLPVIQTPACFTGFAAQDGVCNVCGKVSKFYFNDQTAYREQLNCVHCLTTSRYRSVARGVLRGIKDIAGIEASALSNLPHVLPEGVRQQLAVYDTQPSFYCDQCAYPLPDLLQACDWIDVTVSQYEAGLKPGSEIAPGVNNQNLERLTFADASFDMVITSDVMGHVRLDDLAHREIHRVLKVGGVYIFTVPHDRNRAETQVHVQIAEPNDASRDVNLQNGKSRGKCGADANSTKPYRLYGTDLDRHLEALGFDVAYEKADLPEQGILNTELYYCRKVR